MVSLRKRMNLGKKVTPTGTHRLGVVPPGTYRPGRANWDSNMTRLFLQLALKEIEAEGRGTTQLSDNSLHNIATEISARSGEVINLKQCKNQYRVLKRDWQAWILLAESRRSAMGLAFSGFQDCHLLSHRTRDYKNMQNEFVAKFCDHPLEHEELMQRVFKEVIATGSPQCTSGAEGELGMGADGRRALATDNDDRTDTDGEGNTVGIENEEEIGSEYTSTTPEHGRGTPFCSQQGTSNPLFPQYGGITNLFSPQHGNHSSPFVPQHGSTNTPPFPYHAATNTPPFRQHLRTSPPPFPQHVRTSPPPFSQHEHGTPTTPFWNRGTTSTPPSPQPEIRCSPPLSVHSTNTPPFSRAMPIYPGCNSSRTKWRSTSSGTDALSQSMTNILETMISRQNQYKSVIKHGCNMVDIMKILGQMEYFQQEPVPPVYWWLVDYLSSDPMKMDVFYGLRNDEQRIAFAQREHTKAMLAQSSEQGNPTETLPPWHPPPQI
ncbi:hypothetical protein RHSIM_Rhsim05G0084200 [Rhododendron simsii]|uniref:Myb/SANT-like domain-containing protein n=1 Tax=Rhododendron simsii TaxID=118357 RepID=A0A834GX83_RHOSS|nr:hypothetical protein RHSIM_Rhsim05G0084200 [Rhododendron simsii]